MTDNPPPSSQRTPIYPWRDPALASSEKGYAHPGSFIRLPDQGGVIHFQYGHPQEVGRNGCFLVDVLRALRANLEVYQAEGHPMRCDETDETTHHLTRAIDSIESRKRDRADREVLNTDEA